MKRSTTVVLTIVSSVATSFLAACGRTQRHCVDQSDYVVPDSLCVRRTSYVPGVFGAWYPYRYYYGGIGFRGMGSRLSGGSYTEPRTRSGLSGGGAHVGGTSRGGFGGIGRGFGSAHG